MPGKQMAIDADLNSGLIDADEARRRRERIASEAEFYGAMDGASKFVRGDAIAGLIITALNLVGGIALGSFNGMSIGAAAERYSLITIGDGLVSHIPALLITTASGVLVTKASDDSSLGVQVLTQISGRPRATLIAAGMLFAIGLVPGLPKLPFFLLASLLVIGWRATRGSEDAQAQDEAARKVVPSKAEPSAAEKESEATLESLKIDRIALEIGYRLIPLVQDPRGQGILDHISQLRRRFASRDGAVLPPVRNKDNIKLAPNAYRILVGGQEVARGEIEPGQHLAMDSGAVAGRIVGTETVDPAFGLPALWIPEASKDEAEILGYTVIDPVSVLVTHLAEVLRTSLGDILTRDDVRELVENAKKVSPAVVEELVPAKIGYGEVQAVLRNLLREGVSIRNVPLILEVIADHVVRTKDPDTLAELVRQRLGRALCESHADRHGTVHAVTLDPGIGSAWRRRRRLRRSGEPGRQPAYLQRLVERIGESVASATRGGADVLLARSTCAVSSASSCAPRCPRCRCSRTRKSSPPRACRPSGSCASRSEACRSTEFAAVTCARRSNARVPSMGTTRSCSRARRWPMGA
jgi:flagellar biosynthesis protein FlhA